jgi:tRNA(Arg) A34 adenosine deaminase TadA
MLFRLSRPRWLRSYESRIGRRYPTLAERVALAIELSRVNVERGTGGPFGAAIFERASRRLVAVGVNRVEAMQLSIAHAEVLAIAAAQRRLRTYDLHRGRAHELVSSAEPCAMCTGAVLWSGVTKLVYGASKQDVEQLVGFDEGPKPRCWRGDLAERGIEVVGGLLQNSARDVLRRYHALGGAIYASRQRRARAAKPTRGAARG